VLDNTVGTAPMKVQREAMMPVLAGGSSVVWE
jgi:hypothetical protein